MVRWAVRILAAIGALFLLVLVAPPRWYVRILSSPWEDPQDGVLIVLSADGASDTMLGESSYWRCVYAAMAWKQGHFHHVVVSGHGKAAAMRDFLAWQGIPPGAVIVEDQSGSTRENAMFSAPLLRNLPGPYVLMTSDFHTLRAARTFRKAGVAVKNRPVPDAGKRFNNPAKRWEVCADLAEETVKIAYYWARGWI